MKKVAIYVDTLLRNGAQRVTITLANYFVNHNYKCTIITGSKNKDEFEIPNKVKRFDMNLEEKKYLNYFYNIKKMHKYLVSNNFDIIIGMDMASSLYVIPAVKNTRIKAVISERNDPTHFPGKKIVEIISRRLMRHADGFVFQTEDAQKFYSGITNNKGIVIENPLFLDKLPKQFDGKRSKTIVSAGRLTEQKNFDMLIDAFYKIHVIKPEYKLIIYGEGKLREHLTNKINKLGLQNFVFLPGNISNVLEKIKNSSLFVLSSHYEGMPNILIEALAIGLPCVSTDCPIGGPKALINNGKNGLLSKVDDVDDLTKKMLRILDDDNLSKKISSEAVKIKNRLNSDIICKKWLAYIEQI